LGPVATALRVCSGAPVFRREDAMPQPGPASLAFDDVRIDFAGRRLVRAGAEQPLEPKAFAVLALLAGEPGRAFTRDEILDAVWGHRHVTPGVLNRVMTLLRHALGEDAATPRRLHTVHGVGYRFDLPLEPAAADPAAVPDAVRDAPASPATAQDPPRRRASDQLPHRRRAWWWLAPLLLAALAFAGWWWWQAAARRPASATQDTPRPAALAERSVAVLPLANASQAEDQQFFSDGLSDNLIDALSRFEGLKVVGRVSSFRFRDSQDDSRSIGEKLGAAYLLGGSVQREGGTVRVRATLTRAADGSTLWTEHYDRPYKDLFALQDEIAQAIATALHARLLSGEAASRQSDRPPSGNMAAYDAYLRGMQGLYRGDWAKVIEYQGEATRLDPGYAAAWAQLAVAWTVRGEAEDWGSAAAKQAFAKAHAAVDTALRLAPDLGLAHGALGNLKFTDALDWRGALAELGRGVELAPNDGQIHGGYSRVLAATGRLHEAIGHRQRFIANEPLAAGNYHLLAPLLIGAGRLDEAEKNLSIARELASSPIPSYQLMYIAILRGDGRAALQVAGQQSPPWRDMNLAVAAQLDPDRAAADAALAKVIDEGTWKKTSPYLVAQAYALRGDLDGTMAWLERAWAVRDTTLRQLLYDPLVLRFRDDPRLAAFCSRIGLPPPSASEALGIDQIRAAAAAKR
jgi:TolB-like protein/DNA-binding winged helix-turn-helix (wHTH) protein/Tfp pilus assembly protein PilF